MPRTGSRGRCDGDVRAEDVFRGILRRAADAALGRRTESLDVAGQILAVPGLRRAVESLFADVLD